MTDPTRGVLHARDLPRFIRKKPSALVADYVEWFWIPAWNLPRGTCSQQQVLGYPAGNLVVEGSEVSLWGATTRLSTRELRGNGWAVGALLRPAAFGALTATPRELVNSHVVLEEPALAATVSDVMPDQYDTAVEAVESWLIEKIHEPTGETRLANDMMRILMTDASVLRFEDAAVRLAVSPRTLQRLAHRTVGLPPAVIIRRRRLQEAAQQVREQPDLPLADIAASLGYSDQAHLANDFRTVLGFTASNYRTSTAH